jgi:cold shock CspA family protein
MASAAGIRNTLQNFEDDDILAAIKQALTRKPHLCTAVMEIASELEIMHQHEEEVIPVTAEESYYEDGRRFTGTLKSFVTKSNYGFIACDELFDAFGCDVYLAGFAVNFELTIGAELTFTVKLNKDGKPQAFDLKPAVLAVPDASGQYYENGRRFDGTLKSFVAKSQYGFVACQELFDVFGCDVFLAGFAVNQQIEVGAPVSFTVKLNKDGKPQAFDLLPGHTENLGNWHEGGRRFQGTIKSYVHKSQYGFISCDDLHAQFGCDAFVTSKSIPPDFEIGSAVSFTVQLNKSGKPQAYDCQLIGMQRGMKRQWAAMGW